MLTTTTYFKVSRTVDSQRQLTYIFIFTFPCDAAKGFIKAFKAFVKSFEAPERSVKIKISLIFTFYPEVGQKGLSTLQNVIFMQEKSLNITKISGCLTSVLGYMHENIILLVS